MLQRKQGHGQRVSREQRRAWWKSVRDASVCVCVCVCVCGRVCTRKDGKGIPYEGRASLSSIGLLGEWDQRGGATAM
jgi:hypothetical protein